MDVLLTTVAFVLGIALPWGVVRFDMARLTGQQLDRAWPDSSLWSAIVAFGPLCIPFHFAKTRRSLLGVLLGLVVMVGVFLVAVVVSVLLEGLYEAIWG